MRQQNEALIDAYFTVADTRVMRRLLSIAERVPEVAGVARIRLTQEDLATLAGTTRPTANRVLRELEREGVLELRRGQILVLRRDLLASRATVGPSA